MRHLVPALLLAFTLVPLARAEDDDARQLEVEEVTVFKDGHAFVLEAGTRPVDEEGRVVLDRLPVPVLGTFWPFADQEGMTLASVRAGREIVTVSRTALELPDLLVANVGKEAIVTDDRDHAFHARIVAVPERSTEEQRETSPPSDDEPLPRRGAIVLLETGEGLKAMRLDQIREVTFKQDATREIESRGYAPRLTLSLRGGGGEVTSARVGAMYLQRGLRWIPSYKVDLVDGDKARVRLQATLVNDLRDLHDVAVNLVIGVPTFAFADQVDPVSLQQAAADVARRSPRRAQMGQYFSNAIMSQMPGPMMESAARDGSVPEPEVAGSEGREDLYVFRVEHVTLGKGERLVIPVTDTEMAYEDVYTLDVPFAPPPEVWPQIAQQMANDPQSAEMVRLESSPKVIHEVRLKNDGPHPITTAPALLMQEGRVLAQNLITYTSVGGEVDLPVTTAVDVRVSREDEELDRVPEDVRWRGDTYARIDMKGRLTLTNFKKEPVHVEVTRYVLGTKAEAEGGTVRQINALEDSGWTTARLPVWWRWYGWPQWWYHFNGSARLDWDVTLEPGEERALEHHWSYYWR